MQRNLDELLLKDYYTLDELVESVKINKGMLKKLFKGYRLYKEGYRKSDIIYRLMGKKRYTEDMIEEYYDFIANF
jgi:hypothetical protein